MKKQTETINTFFSLRRLIENETDKIVNQVYSSNLNIYNRNAHTPNITFRNLTITRETQSLHFNSKDKSWYS